MGIRATSYTGSIIDGLYEAEVPVPNISLKIEPVTAQNWDEDPSTWSPTPYVLIISPEENFSLDKHVLNGPILKYLNELDFKTHREHGSITGRGLIQDEYVEVKNYHKSEIWKFVSANKDTLNTLKEEIVEILSDLRYNLQVES